MAKTHLRDDDATACRLSLEGLLWTGGAARTVDTLAELRALPARDRCKRCEARAARAIADAIDSGEDEAPYVAPPPRDRPPPDDILRHRTLTRTARRVLADAGKARDPEPRQWPSPVAAIRSYVQSRAEGASLRSTTDPDRAQRVQHSRDPSLGGREHAAVDRHATVSRALSQALATLEGGPLCPEDALEGALLVLVGQGVRVACKPVGGEARKGRPHMEWRGRLPEDAAIAMSERTGTRVHAGHVEAWVRHFTEAVRDALLASGEMGARGGETRDRARRVWDPTKRIREARG